MATGKKVRLAVVVRVVQGHVLDVLAKESAQSVHCVVTSPPYLWARSYGTEPQTWPSGWVGELGQEPTPELFIEHLVTVMAAVCRVLRDDGTLWVNLAGSSYNDPGGQNGATGNLSEKAVAANAAAGRQRRAKHPYLKPLDWVDTPGLFANAMQRDGWSWRSDVTWIKDSPMPEPISGTTWTRCRVKVAKNKAADPLGRGGYQQMMENPERHRGVNPDWLAEWKPCPGCKKCDHPDPKRKGYVLNRHNGRPAKATERILLFTKRSGAYYDAEGVREPESASVRERAYLGKRPSTPGQEAIQREGFHGKTDSLSDYGRTGRNLWNWWRIKGENLKDEHYAAYPSGLPAKCIAAGSSDRGCCPSCGAPWARCVEQRTLERYELPTDHPHYRPGRYTNHGQVDPVNGGGQRLSESTTLGWLPTCACPELPPVPCRILDPFGGAGTTALAADRLGRDAVLVELKPTYAAMAQRRLTADAPLFMDVSVEGAAAG